VSVKAGLAHTVPLETCLTTAKIFLFHKKYSEAWDYIKDLPENFSYEVPLYKAGILIQQPHDKSVFYLSMVFLNKALAFPNLSKEARALIYRYIGIAYLEEKKDYGKSLEFAEKAIVENPVFWSAHIVKGRALKRIGPDRLSEAIETLEIVIGEDKTYEVAYYNLGCYYSLKAEREKNPIKRAELKKMAIDHYKTSVRLNEENRTIAEDDPDLEFIKSDIKDI
jgi:tetratricopeptide (TPR) repeat protein